MIALKVTFVNYEYDNYQGASGKVFKREKLIALPSDLPISEVKTQCIDWLHSNGFVDQWGERAFRGNGLISIEHL